MLQKTKNYNLFLLSDFNRNVTKTKKLEQSMRKHGFIDAYPLHVIKKGKFLEIKGGHHRFEVASKLGLAIPYVVTDDDATIHELEEATTKWTMSDYLVSFVRMGYPDYEKVESFCKKTGISIQQAMSMMGGELASSHNHNDAFKRGKYKVSNDLTPAYRVAELVKILSDYGHKWAVSAVCVTSLSRLIIGNIAQYDQLKQKLSVNVSYFDNKRSVDGFMEQWEEAYNRKSRGSRTPLVFLTNEAIKKRSATYSSSK
jgi:hypothetical protein